MLPIRTRILVLFALFGTFLLAAQADAGPPTKQGVKRFSQSNAMADETKLLVHWLENTHYHGHPVSDIEGGHLIEEYIDTFDSHRLFFTQKEVDGFKLRYAGNITENLEEGNLYPAFRIFENYRDAARERIDWIQNRLEEPWSFETDETFAPDRSELKWPNDLKQADRLWEKRLKYELINEILGSVDPDMDEEADSVSLDIDNPDDYQKLINEAVSSISKRYGNMLRSVEGVESSEVQEMFLTALANMYDPHSTFLSADSLEEFAIAMQNSLVGIGAILSDIDGYCTIRELLPGGPAERSRNLDPEDKIVGVAQGHDGEMVDVIGMKLRKVVKMIRGPKGTIVRLLIRPGEGDPSERREVLLVRDQIKLTANLAKAEVHEVPTEDGGTALVGVIDLPAFYGPGKALDDHSSTTHDVRELLNKLKGMNVQGIVLDLRRNGGGLLSEAIDMAGLFIPRGPVVQVKDTIGHVREFKVDSGNVIWDGPLVVLVSRYSASASEIVAGALQNHRRAIVVGDRTTHGKGTVQAVFEMNRKAYFRPQGVNLGAAKITVQKYYLPDGSSTQIEGVHADIPLPSFNEFLPIGEGDLNNALIWDRIDSSPFDFSTSVTGLGLPVEDGLVQALRASSAERQQSLDEFAYLRRNIDWFRSKQEQKEISINLNKRRSTRQGDENFRDSMDARLEELSEMAWVREEILLEVTRKQKEESDALLTDEDAEPAPELAAIEAETEAMDEEAEEADEPDFDIHLRESLRILVDWLEYVEDQQDSGTIAAAPAENTSS
ncbi:MAG: carboxy terminal-processing peptidase [Opitutales bacterium]